MDFPLSIIERCETPEEMTSAFNRSPLETWKADDYLVVFSSEEDIKSLSPNFDILKTLDCRGIIATARGNSTDFVSRFFAPQCGINEDSVTGSAHCALTPDKGLKSNRSQKKLPLK